MLCRQHYTAVHHPHIDLRTGGKPGVFQPLTFHGEGGNTSVFRVAARITHGQMTVICREDFWIGGFCNRMRGSRGLYSFSIGIVISGAGVLAHARTALNTWIYHQ